MLLCHSVPQAVPCASFRMLLCCTQLYPSAAPRPLGLGVQVLAQVGLWEGQPHSISQIVGTAPRSPTSEAPCAMQPAPLGPTCQPSPPPPQPLHSIHSLPRPPSNPTSASPGPTLSSPPPSSMEGGRGRRTPAPRSSGSASSSLGGLRCVRTRWCGWSLRRVGGRQGGGGVWVGRRLGCGRGAHSVPCRWVPEQDTAGTHSPVGTGAAAAMCGENL